MTCVHSHRQVLWWYGTAYAIVLWSIAAATGEWVYPNMDWSDPYSLVAYVLLPLLPFIAFLLWCAAPLRPHPRAPGSSGAQRPARPPPRAWQLWCAAPLRAHPRAPGSSGARRPCAPTPARLAALVRGAPARPPPRAWQHARAALGSQPLARAHMLPPRAAHIPACSAVRPAAYTHDVTDSRECAWSSRRLASTRQAWDAANRV